MPRASVDYQTDNGAMAELVLAEVEAAVLAASGEVGERALCERLTGLSWSELEASLLMLRGVPEELSARELVARVASLLGSTRAVAAGALGVSSSRVYRNDRVSVDMLDRVLALCRQWFYVCRVVGAEGAGSWFQDSNPGLDGARPLDLLDTGYGQRKVYDLIWSLLYGGIV